MARLSVCMCNAATSCYYPVHGTLTVIAHAYLCYESCAEASEVEPVTVCVEDGVFISP